MFNILVHEGNANQSDMETSSHSTQSDCHKRTNNKCYVVCCLRMVAGGMETSKVVLKKLKLMQRTKITTTI
jgi:hypothetical protein